MNKSFKFEQQILFAYSSAGRKNVVDFILNYNNNINHLKYWSLMFQTLVINVITN